MAPKATVLNQDLSWLEPALNREVGNAEFSTKLQAYGRSEYRLSNSIPASVGDIWSAERLDARQQQMARRAVHLWRADFA